MTAIIPAAGHGTRFLPVTKVVPKEMLPIGSKPALELIVDEAKSAGADRIVLIISHGKELIREYFKDDPSVTFVYQEEQRGLGHAILMAEKSFSNADALKSDLSSEHRSIRPSDQVRNVLILLGDCLVADCNASKEMVALSKARGDASVIGLERVPRERISRYGIVKTSTGGRMVGCSDAPMANHGHAQAEGDLQIIDLVEKPSVEEAPSDLAVAGRYLLDAKIFDYLKTQTPGKGGEIQLTDAIRRMLAEKTLLAYVYPGKRQDIGNPKGYFEALKAMGANA